MKKNEIFMVFVSPVAMETCNSDMNKYTAMIAYLY